MNKNKLRRTAAILLLTVMLCMTAAAAFCEPADAGQAENDPYDWSDYEGEVILDDPEFFMFDEETLDENQGETDNGGNSQEQQGNDTQEENEEQPTESPAENPSQQEPGEQPPQASETPDDPAGESGEDPAQPPDDPAAQPEQPADLKSLFLVEIKVPAGWFNLPEKAVRLKITPQSDTLWSKIQYRLNDGEWTEIRERFSFQDGYYYIDLTVTQNCSLTVRLLNDTGDSFDTHKEIHIFDHQPPEVTAGIKNTMLHVVAVDDLSEVAGIQVNGLLFTTLEDGILDVRMEEPLNTYRQLAIRAYDYAGNFSDPVTLDNPYYTEPTPTPKPTKKPTVTKEPTPSPTSAPTAKPTKKPSGNTSSNKDTETVKATKAPVETSQAEKQEPIVIILTPPPTAEPAPTPTPEIQYVPLGPGQPFTQHGNMATRDVLYSASTNKQFISVQSRNGQTYYMVIDYDKPIDEENEIYETYFLNLVDDRDLMSVLTDEEIVPTPTPQIIYVTPEPTQVPPPTSAPVETPVKQETRKMDSTTVLLLLLLIVLAVGGFAAWFITSQNKKKTPRIPEYDEDEEYEVEDSEDDPNVDM